jgi:hypothetical protein
MKLPRIPKTISRLLENKYVLYFVLFLAVSNVLGYMTMGNTTALILFILIAILMTFFSKNMIIVLAVPIVLTSTLLVGNKVAEGFAGKAGKAKKATVGTKQIGEESEDAPTSDKTKESDGIPPDSVPITPKATKDGMSLYKKKNNRIDYASTLENSYSDLNNILGKDGIKSLTTDTKKLMDQQMELADALKGMSPLIGQAKDMLKGIDVSGLMDLAGKMKQ